MKRYTFLILCCLFLYNNTIAQDISKRKSSPNSAITTNFEHKNSFLLDHILLERIRLKRPQKNAFSLKQELPMSNYMDDFTTLYGPITYADKSSVLARSRFKSSKFAPRVGVRLDVQINTPNIPITTTANRRNLTKSLSVSFNFNRYKNEKRHRNKMKFKSKPKIKITITQEELPSLSLLEKPPVHRLHR